MKLSGWLVSRSPRRPRLGTTSFVPPLSGSARPGCAGARNKMATCRRALGEGAEACGGVAVPPARGAGRRGASCLPPPAGGGDAGRAALATPPPGAAACLATPTRPGGGPRSCLAAFSLASRGPRALTSSRAWPLSQACARGALGVIVPLVGGATARCRAARPLARPPRVVRATMGGPRSGPGGVPKRDFLPRPRGNTALDVMTTRPAEGSASRLVGPALASRGLGHRDEARRRGLGRAIRPRFRGGSARKGGVVGLRARRERGALGRFEASGRLPATGVDRPPLHTPVVADVRRARREHTYVARWRAERWFVRFYAREGLPCEGRGANEPRSPRWAWG